ncbi:MAG: tRNA (guanosine(46)-N7)-methyltransferase TrmB [Bacilli bacterium]|nr:tRNA (guanosine(46)-N7)-methyltransferase TrmB [Bacilli bacterium]
MRLRNVKNASEIVKKHPLVIKYVNEKTFGNSNPIHLEIGSGKGDFLIGMAKKYPNINFVGIEKYESVLVRALEKIEELPNNLKFMAVDAKNLEEIILIKIKALYLNFSDPWPKHRHEKRRLTSKEFLLLYEKIFEKQIDIYLKTDNKNFFSYSLESLSQNNYTLAKVSLDLHQTDIPNVMTEYEQKFSAKGETINYLHATKMI